eukprot:tig00020556_g10983.t1
MLARRLARSRDPNSACGGCYVALVGGVRNAVLRTACCTADQDTAEPERPHSPRLPERPSPPPPGSAYGSPRDDAQLLAQPQPQHGQGQWSPVRANGGAANGGYGGYTGAAFAPDFMKPGREGAYAPVAHPPRTSEAFLPSGQAWGLTPGAPPKTGPFLSGTWIGYYEYLNGQRDEITMDLNMAGGLVRSVGSDALGRFEIDGQFDPTSLEIKFTKQYIGMHRIEYLGFSDGNCIRGDWEIIDTRGNILRGGFRLWKPGTYPGFEKVNENW